MIKSISKLIDINADWNNGTLTDVVAVNDSLELWRPDLYGSFDDSLDLLKKDDTTISPEIGAVATLRPNEGKFSGAVAVEEGTTNLASTPKDLSSSDWTNYNIIVDTNAVSYTHLTLPTTPYV